MEINGKNVKKRVYVMPNDPYKKYLYLCRSGKEFTHTHTQRTTKIQVGNEVYYWGGSDYKAKEWHLQRKLKNEIRQNIKEKGLVVPKYTEDDIRYYNYSDYVFSLPLDYVMNGIVEYDVNKAYYQCAYNLGYMSEELYNECIKLPKKIRLRFIGTIATFKRKYHKKGFKIIDYEEIVDKDLRDVWFHICKNVDMCLSEFKQLVGDRFLFYYVDGIYLKNGDYSEELNYLYSKYSFIFKKEDTRGIRRFVDNNGHQGVIAYKFNPDKNKVVEKPFFFPREKKYRSDKFKILYEKLIQQKKIKPAINFLKTRKKNEQKNSKKSK